jgi:hypothetical protein
MQSATTNNNRKHENEQNVLERSKRKTSNDNQKYTNGSMKTSTLNTPSPVVMVTKR